MAASRPVTERPGHSATLVERAADLAPVFAERVPEAFAARRLHQQTIDDLRTAGLLRVYVPERWGGDGLHMQDVLPSVARLARGCPSAAWVLAVYQIHNWVVALMPEPAQAEVFGDGPDPVIAASLNPMKNTARAVDGGCLIERGSFPFCSGGAAREWVLVGVQVQDDGGDVTDVGACLVPGVELEEKDDWFVSGLQATGSMSLVAEDCFVPAHRFLSYADALAGTSAGRGSNPEALFNAAFVPMLVLNLGGPALGIAERAVSEFADALVSKPGAYPITGEARADAPQAHTVLAEAEMRTDIARMLLDRAGQAIRDAAEAPGRMPRAAAAKACVDTTWASRECLAAVQSLFLHSGGGVLMPQHPLQQAYQDVSAINCHGFLSHESAVRLYGSLASGHEEATAFV